MTLEEVQINYADLINDWLCVEAYVGRDGALYYRHDDADPVTAPGQITFNKITNIGATPAQITTVEFHEAQKGNKLK